MDFRNKLECLPWQASPA